MQKTIAKWQIFIPASEPELLNKTITVEAHNWMDALTDALEQMGKDGPEASNLMLDIKDGAVHATDLRHRRVFEITKISDSADSETPHEDAQPHHEKPDNRRRLGKSAVPQSKTDRPSAGPQVDGKAEAKQRSPRAQSEDSAVSRPAHDEPKKTKSGEGSAVDVSEKKKEHREEQSSSSGSRKPRRKEIPAQGDVVAHSIFFERNDEPAEKSRLTYRERLFAVEAGTTSEQAEKLLRHYYKLIKSEIKKRPRGKFINLAVFDHIFHDRARRPALAALDWKDWRRKPNISFPLESPAVVETSFIPGVEERDAEKQDTPSGQTPNQEKKSPAAELAVEKEKREQKRREEKERREAEEREKKERREAEEREKKERHEAEEREKKERHEAEEREKKEREQARHEKKRKKKKKKELEEQRAREREERERKEREREERERKEREREERERQEREREERERKEREREERKREERERKERERKEREREEREREKSRAPSQRMGIGRHSEVPDLNEVLIEVFEAMQELYFISSRTDSIKFAIDLIAEKIPCMAVAGLSKVQNNPEEMICVTMRGDGPENIVGQKVTLPGTVLGLAVHQGVAVAVSDAQNDSRVTADIEHLIDEDTRSVLCVPFVFEGRTFGAAELINRQGGDSWHQGEIHIVSYVANHLSEYIAQSLPPEEDLEETFAAMARHKPTTSKAKANKTSAPKSTAVKSSKSKKSRKKKRS